MNELASITTEELGLLLEELHEPKFRTSQVMKWLAKGVPPKEMLNIPKTLREKLSAFPFGGVGIIECKQSKKDDSDSSFFVVSVRESAFNSGYFRKHFPRRKISNLAVQC